MLSHVEMAPAAAGFKLFGKVITQCADDGGGGAPAAVATPVFVAREKEEHGERPEQEVATIKREAAELELDEKPQQQQGGGGAGGPAAARRTTQQQLQEAAEARAAAMAPLPCPRCRSRDTKFCYFNNYNVNQPRHFCKACHRYWTAGGALRNVPVGAGRRKNRPLGPVATVAGHHHHHHRAAGAAATAAGFVLGFPNPSSPTSLSPPPVYTDRWPVGPDRRF